MKLQSSSRSSPPGRDSPLPIPDPATRLLPTKRTSPGRVIASPSGSGDGQSHLIALETGSAPIVEPRWEPEPPRDPAFGPGEMWPELEPGTVLTVIKQDPVGALVTKYPAVVLDRDVPPGWVLTEARWVNQAVDLDGLVFTPGDRLVEAFSAVTPFNSFAVYDPVTGGLRGWYANVAYPAHMDVTTDSLVLIWRDLYLDVIGRPDGFMSLRDEDELDASGLRQRNPDLHHAIVATAAAVIERLQQRRFPFISTM